MRKYSAILLVAFSILLVVNAKAQIASGEYSNEDLVLSNLSSMPLAFTENQGQFGEKTLFKANAAGATFYFCNNEVAYLFVRDTDELIEDDVEEWHAFPKDKSYGSVGHAQVFDQSMPPGHPRYKKESMLIKAQFIGANPNPEVIGADRLPHNNNYFYGNDPAKWRTDVPNYSTIIYKDIYPGIDLKYYGDGRSMKYDFIVNPGGDISQIKIRYEGVDHLSVTPAGDLQARTRFGLIHEKAPLIYQKIGGVKQELAGRYEITGAGVFSFVIEEGFNPAYPLIIDPELVYSTYLGGNDDDYCRSFTIDNENNIYIVGSTSSDNFPLVDPYDGVYNDSIDIFISKLNLTSNTLVYSTYLGGISHDIVFDITVDTYGNIYLTGTTTSSDFPTANAYDDTYNGGWIYGDVFVVKLSESGDSLIYSTYIGTNDMDSGTSVDIFQDSIICITGYTYSPSFPMVNPYSTYGGLSDVVILKIDPLQIGINTLIYSTYLGGSHYDWSHESSIDVDGNIYLTCQTYSTDFPVTTNAYDMSHNGERDVFIAKLSSSGDSLLYGSFFGGTEFDIGNDLFLKNDTVYVAGLTCSDNLPVINAYDDSFNGGEGGYYSGDGFVAKFSLNPGGGNSLLYSTYLGGENDDNVAGIYVDTTDIETIFLAGWTRSPDFPTVNPIYGSINDSTDAFIAQINTANNGINTLSFSSFLGGEDHDNANDILINSEGLVLIAGRTRSADFPIENGYQPQINGMYDGFISAIDVPTDINEIGILPQHTTISTCFPNPFNNSTNIEYVLNENCHVSLTVYDLLGRKVQTLINKYMQVGYYMVTFDASDLSSGVYFYRFRAGDVVETRRMVLLK